MRVKDLDYCERLCYQHDNCVSLNIKKDPDSATGQQECELNNSTHMEHDEDLTVDNAYFYRGAKVISIKLLFYNILLDSEDLGKYSARSTEPEAINCLSKNIIKR